MSAPYEDAIETFMSITGVSEATAIRKLEEHHGNLNGALNAYLNEKDRNREASYTAPLDDAMAIDDPIPAVAHRPAPLFPFPREFNPFSMFEHNFLREFSRPLFSSPRPFVSHPTEAREIPIEVNEGTETSGHSVGTPFIEDVTETACDHWPEVHGNVVIDNDDEDDVENIPATQSTLTDGYGNASTRPSVPTITPEADYINDIEEEMIRAAIEASKRDAAKSNQQDDDVDLQNPNGQSLESHHEDLELDHVVSLSLQIAEQENALRELYGKGGDSEIGTLKSVAPEVLEKVMPSNGRQSQLEVGSSSIPLKAEDTEELPLVRHRRRRSSIHPVEVSKDSEEFEDSPPSSPQLRDSDRLPHPRGSNFPSEEWGGLSSEEHNEAVMLEAAMFGGIPEGSGYYFPYATSNLMENGYSMHVPHPPSPSLTAQRLLREQQDDEYIAALQADREKELKAKDEAEVALAEERRKEEEIRKKQQEEQEIERQLAAKEASLPQEPSKDDVNAVTLLVRMPDGSRRGRRFLKSDHLQHLIDFIDVGRGVKPGSYRLVRPYPRRAFSDEERTSTLDELGLTCKQEALYLELI